KATDATCANTVTSSMVTITVDGTLTAGTIGTAQTICYNTAPATLTTVTNPNGGSGVYTYQWQSSPDNVTWSNVSGATNNSYTSVALTSTTYFRDQITDPTCGTVNTASVKITVDPVISNNTVSTLNQTICINDSPLQITGVAPTGGSGAYTYQWQSSSDGVTWSNIGGATTISYTPPAVAVAGSYYFQRIVTSGPCTSTSNSIIITVLSSAPPTPTTSTFGSGVWNAYVYTDNNFGNNGGAYAGYYTEPLISFASTSRYTNNQSPSYASGYQGCQVANTNFSESFKQTNFASAIYQIDLASIKDRANLLINGVQVFTGNAATNNIWTGTLGSTDQVEIQWIHNTGTSNIAINVTQVSNPGADNPGAIGGNQSVCYNQAPQQAFSNTTSPTSNGCYITGYQWQLSTDSIIWNNISGATSLTYTETNTLTQSQWYRR